MAGVRNKKETKIRIDGDEEKQKWSVMFSFMG
jgi:hypothetical protein